MNSDNAPAAESSDRIDLATGARLPLDIVTATVAVMANRGAGNLRLPIGSSS
ncbi:hypothetical protein [Mycolicibacterium goodii]|uniref:Uncharacterized protein n=1 Tax=Mycolicibacterium goodii TaxID=134601 RepID=A0ABS6HKP8_MYCGD|nr:hypothetical protein [Mycolicibacterium goodii]MBU8810095.1 hypothetical protein [Mycolicibacterium goodii]MBU8821948.1 hypothetical protein [Mycolicibacterium goodii]MBU8828443.1 hypothetical protein [Mycolicibacterium goodii]MBU8838728.1 hypothetical protein [Mycolicibacterium goodii]ULN49254.1 hypothetical protein MI170_07820 [Mycolicibacterium goodii]